MCHRWSRGSRPIVHLWVRNLSLCVFRGSKTFPRGWFVGSEFFSWVLRGSKSSCRGYSVGPKFFLVVFRGSKFFSRGYFVGLKFFLVGIFWVQIFFSWIFRGSKTFYGGYFVSKYWICKWEIRINRYNTPPQINSE